MYEWSSINCAAMSLQPWSAICFVNEIPSYDSQSLLGTFAYAPAGVAWVTFAVVTCICVKLKNIYN